MANRVKDWRVARGFTQQQLASRINTTHATIQRLENGWRRLDEDWIHLLSAALRCRPGDLLEDNVHVPRDPVVPVKCISWVAASEMHPDAHLTPGDDDDVVYVSSKRSRLFALEVVGRSMDRVAPPGSRIIVDMEDCELIDGRFYVFRNSDGATFKRWRVEPPRLEPYSTDPAYEPIFHPSAEAIGRVIQIQHSV